jgi:regulatory protein
VKLHPESAKLFQIDEAVEKAKNMAMRLLSGRAYTQREIQDKLISKGCGEQAIVETLKTLNRLGLIDDRRFARQFVEERMRLKPAGRMFFSRDLKRRGVPEAIAVEVLDEIFSEADPQATATDLLIRRAHRYRGLPRDKALSRMYGFLGRRGFDASIARAAAQAVWAGVFGTTDEHR